MVIGGKLASIGSNAKIGDGEIIVAEADESDGSFLKLNPCLAVITNIDLEHLDYYRDIDEIKAAFLKLPTSCLFMDPRSFVLTMNMSGRSFPRSNGK